MNDEIVECEICGKPAVARCRICGRPVCEDHYVANRGVCSICAKTLCEFCGERLAINTCAICGRLGCDRCLVQVDPSRWVCRECLEKYADKKKLAEITLCRPSSTLARSLWG